MQQFRDLTNNIFFKIFLSFVGLSFIFFGISDLVFESNNSWVAKINGKKISQIEFSRELENQKANLYSKNPSPELMEYVNSEEFKNIILQRITAREILKNLIAEMDLDLHQDLAINQILNQKEFQDEKGNFDKMRFQSFLNINNLNSEKYLEQLNFEMSSDMIFSALDIENIAIDQDLLKEKYQFQNQERIISLLKIKEQKSNKKINIDESELKKFYRKNKDKYKSDELRKISLITIKQDSLTSDIKISDQEISQSYQNNDSKYIIPEKREIYNILLDDIKKAEDFISKIDKKKDLKKQFKKIAKKYFDKDENEISLNIAKKQLPKQISDQIFNLEEKTMSNILESEYGYHVIYIDNIIKSYKNPLKNVKQDIKEKLLKEKSSKIINQKIIEIEDEIMILDDISDFSKDFPFAKIEKMPAINSNMVSDKGKKINNANISKIIEDIFFLDEGQFSEINKSDEEDLYYIAFIEKIIEEKQKTLKEVESDIKKEITLIKKSKFLQEKSQEIANKIKDNPKKINQISKEYNAKLLKNITIKRGKTSYPNHFISNIFDLKKNNISNAIRISDKEYYIAILHEINLPNIDEISEEKLTEIENKYKNDISSDLWNKLEKYLNQKYKVINQ
jgi:peptidyl-prolyl cis-trans isomerase D